MERAFGRAHRQISSNGTTCEPSFGRPALCNFNRLVLILSQHIPILETLAEPISP